MKAKEIGSRGLLFPFKDPFLTNVYVILGNERVYVLDTFLGLDSMKSVKQEIAERGYDHQAIVIFNSHGDYDHYWGNAAFENALIIGHTLCRDRILREHEDALQANKKQRKGEVILKAPSLIFSNSIHFSDDGVKFYHTPGHTIDSATCYDEKDKVLFVGDNVETPIPYVYNTDIAQFCDTLKSYLEIDWKVMIASHAPPMYQLTLLKKNIEYLDKLCSWTIELSSLNDDELHLHKHNIEYLRENLEMENLISPAKKHFKEMEDFKE